MNYTFHQLHIFFTITQTQSITKAAEILHLTQPAVSIQLKNFQDQFDLPLTETIGKKIYITDFGKEIAVIAENIISQVKEISYKTLNHKGQLGGELRISIASTGKYVMPFFLSGFLKNHRGVDVKMDVTNKAKVITSLEKNEVDFALVSILPTHLHVESIELLDNKLYLVGNTDAIHELKGQWKIEDLPLIYREKGSGTRVKMEQFIEQQQISANKKLELTSSEAVKQAILAGMGYSIMPLIGIKNELINKELSVIPHDGLPIQTAWKLVWAKGKNLSPVALAFKEYITQNKQSIIESAFHWYEAFDV